MPDGVFCTDALTRIVGQQLVQYVLQILGAACGEELLDADALLGREVDLHVRGLALEPFQDFLLGSAEHVIDAVDLVEFVLAGEEGLLGDEFEEDAPEAPDVHLLVVVAVGHEALGGAVPACGDIIGIGRGGVLALARPQICQFDQVPLDEYIFGLDVAMEDAFAVHEVDGA